MKPCATHHDLWAGIDLKLDNARFHFEGMDYALRPPEPLPHNLALMVSTGATFDHARNWHREFYAHLDAFLSAARSVPEIIRCCFGVDDGPQEMKRWLNTHDADQQSRRRKFGEQFKADYDDFRSLPLGTARNISEHRTGFPPVTVTISGRFGVTYAGDPITRLPIREPPTVEGEWRHGSSGGMMPAPRPLWPNWSDFDVNGEPLYDACRSYVQAAQALVERARALAEEVHGDGQLSRPPNDI